MPLTVPLGPWLPDTPAISTPHLRDARGCLPALKAYEPLPSLSVTTDALTAKCIGAFRARDTDQTAHMYAGDATKLYELEGLSWTDRSRVGGYGPVTDSSRWRFTTFGDRLIAVNGIDEPQYIDMSTAATAFADLAGSPPFAQFIATYREFVVLGALSTNSMTIKWSGFDDSEEWTPGTDQSDEQEFTDGGRITGLASIGDQLFVFQEKCIRRVLYVGGDVIMQIDKVVEGVGCVEANSLVVFGSLAFFLSEDGWYQFDGGAIAPIGVEMVDEWFQADSSRSYWYLMSAAIDPRRKIVAFAYVSTGTAPDSILFYNWVAKKWSYVRMDTEILVEAFSLGVSLDDLTGSVDDYTVSFDDPSFLGGTFYFAAFTQAHKLASFAGDAVEATLEPGSVAPFPGRRALVTSARILSDTTEAAMEMGAAVRPGDDMTFGAAATQQTSGRIPVRASGFYVRPRVVIPAGATWTYAEAVEIEAVAQGAR